MFELTKKAIDTQALKECLKDDQAGALLTFEGVVRNHNEGKAVSALSYEACDSLAEAEAKRIFAEVKERFQVIKCVLVHRTGLLQIGEAAVFVGVSAAHRDQAYLASRYIIDETKKRLPVWKKEFYCDDSSAWVNCSHSEHAHADKEKVCT
ncbi:MAG: molybdenum cofactor biosynthesis protein MoaE [Cyanobacteria bacterium SZAS LIN-2]|nr:molybdenum cofactor biosynthesis protein MoaE [Cyanobacteria bacterium SZAS LIN-2]